MPPSGTEKYSLLPHGENVDEEWRVSPTMGDMNDRLDSSFHESKWAQARDHCISSFVLFMSVMTNLVMGAILVLLLNRPAMMVRETNIDQIDKSPYAKLSIEPGFRFPYTDGYGPAITNHTLADIRWESIDIDPGIIAIDQDWATEHNLIPTQPFPWDASKGVYTISAFHTLHCLKNLHRMIYDAHHGRPLSRGVGHAMHCIDHMRKDAMCNADDFLLPTPPEKYGMMGPRGQSRVCKNWDKLVQWANEHNACYQHITDDEKGFAKDHKEIERYANCPADSPYRARMERYFIEHGMDLEKLIKRPVYD